MEDRHEHILLSPISDAAPCGKLMIYDEEYEAVQNQIAFLSSPDPSIISWRKVLEHSENILREKSKDLTIACYWSVAQLELEEFHDFAGSVEFLTGLISVYWEDMYPDKKRLRGRKNAISWWLDRLEFRISNFHSVKTDIAGIVHAGKKIVEFELMLRTKFSDKFEIFAVVNRGLVALSKVVGVDDNVNKVESSELDKSINSISIESSGTGISKNDIEFAANDKSIIVVSEPKLNETPTVYEINKPPNDLNSEGDVTQFLRERQQELLKVSKYLLGKSSRDPRGYYLNRVAAWLTVKASPVDRGDGVTPFQPVSSEQHRKILNLWNMKEYEALVILCEELFPIYPYSLDLHRFSALSLMYMGDDYKLAKDVVESELQGFLARFPEMTRLMFKNGEPFAGSETKEWIAGQIFSRNIQVPPEVQKNEESGFNAVLPSANLTDMNEIGIVELDENISFEGKIVSFQTTLARVKSKREKFKIKLAQAEYCYREGKYDLAISQLEHLGKQSERYLLEYWEQELVKKVICLHLQSYISLMTNGYIVGKEVASEIDELYYKLCQLDLVEAAKYDTKKWRTTAIH